MTDLSGLALALGNHPGFVSGRIALGPPALRNWLHSTLRLDHARAAALGCCRWPMDARFGSDVDEVAEFVHVRSQRLAHCLRIADVAIALADAPNPLELGGAETATGKALAAAHDSRAAERSLRARRSGGPAGQAEAMRRAGASVWDGASADAVEWIERELPIAVVEMVSPDLIALRRWLTDIGIRVAPVGTFSLLGFLIAWRGRGLVFLDQTLDENWKRVVLGHEIGHFLLDHHLPRRLLIDEQPSLLEVYDGHRTATSRDRFIAGLHRLPTGPHAESLVRGADGSPTHEVEELEDGASEFALELLCPLDRAIELAITEGLHTVERKLAVRCLTTAITTHFRLPEATARLRAVEVIERVAPRNPFS